MKPNELTNLFTVAVVKLWHTVDGLYMWVCPVRQFARHYLAYRLSLAGSSSPPLTTSGVYFVSVANTCGRYGSVAEKHFF